MVFGKHLFSGKSRRNVNEIKLSIFDIRKIDDFKYCFRVAASGLLESHERTFEACSEFDCLVHGMSFLRQHLRFFVEENPGVKIFEEVYGNELLELSVDEVFGTQDCIPEDLQIAYEWALKNGYET